MAPREVLPVNQGWSFKQVDEDDDGWLPVAQFPTNVHLDLLAHNRIPDPFIGKNELEVQWIGERQWVYRTSFLSPPTIPSNNNGSSHTLAVLAFDGLDTFAKVVLNGHTILESDNMFLPARVDVTTLLSLAGQPNSMVITFDSAYLRGWNLVEEHPDHKWGCWNGDNSRLAVRKAQYHWGWDWGPTLMTCGPWRPIHLELYDARISDLHFETNVDKSLKHATVVAHAEVETSAAVDSTRQTVQFDVFLDGATVASEVVVVDVEQGGASATFHINSPALWYPVRYGSQPLYTVRATLRAEDPAAIEPQKLDISTKTIGLRRAELVQRPMLDQPGTSFFFEINNIPVFCGGSDWIPADNFLPRISDQSYYDWVKLVAEGNQFMIRVWGGGIYESQAFYDACDKLGILVWQDFMFGCGNYPAWPSLRTSIQLEAEANVRLLRHHPSIVIWAGNNEDYQYQESESLTYDFENKDAESWLQTDFPARYIYEKILADVCAALIPDTYYHFGSPWGAGVDTHDATVGDIHQWNVWHGSQEKYQNFDKLVGRFVSEFGMEAFPSVRTIDAYLPKGQADPDRYPQSSTVDFHNKADGHERRIALYMVENMRYAPDPLEQFVYCTQLMQAECLASAYRLWKRQWKGPGREYCGGALVWQINDCWPVTSWSICDYYLRPKLAYFTVKREMAPVSVGMARREHAQPANRYTRVDIVRRTEVEIWGSNLTQQDITVDCVVRAWDVETGCRTYEQRVATGLLLRKNQSTEIAVLTVPAKQPGDEARTVVAAYLERAHGHDADADTATTTAALDGGDGRHAPIARYVNWPEPLKYLHLAQPKHLVARPTASGDAIEVSAEVPVKGVALEVASETADEIADAVHFDDNLVDVVPGDVVRISVRGLTASTRIRTRYLGMSV